MKRRNMLSRVIGLTAALGAILAGMAPHSSLAQGTYPNKPIRMIVPLAAGSAVDNAARILAQKMSTNMGQQVVVENLTGAAGIIGADRLAKSAPDGYTIGGFNDSVITMVPNLNPNTPFNPLKDFAMVSLVATIDFGLAVTPNAPYRSLGDLIAAAKAAPGSINYASGGNGSPQHIGGAMFAAHTGINLTHVPYKGATQAAQDVAAGQVPMTMQGLATVAGLVRGGKLRLLAVTMKARHPQFPDVPTFAEQGVNGFEYNTWFGVTAPAGTPKDIVDRLNSEILKALADPEVKSRYENLGLASRGTSPDEMLAITRDQLGRYARVVKEANIKAD
jgi:tripartite-type tricarboxylate transporter receptor subunit TctC